MTATLLTHGVMHHALHTCNPHGFLSLQSWAWVSTWKQFEKPTRNIHTKYCANVSIIGTLQFTLPRNNAIISISKTSKCYSVHHHFELSKPSRSWKYTQQHVNTGITLGNVARSTHHFSRNHSVTAHVQ